MNVSSLTAGYSRHHTSASDQEATAWLHASTSIIRRYQTRNGGKDLGLAANATSISASPQDVWGKSYENLRTIKASLLELINTNNIQLIWFAQKKYDPNSVFNKFHPIPPIGHDSEVLRQPGVGENGHLRVRESL